MNDGDGAAQATVVATDVYRVAADDDSCCAVVYDDDLSTGDPSVRAAVQPAARSWSPTVRPPRLGGAQRVGVFAVLQIFSLTTGVANGIAVAYSGSFNFLMNRNITFRASSNFWRSVAMFVALYVRNFLFGTWFIGWAATVIGCPEVASKFITMAMQGIWGFLLCKFVIFK